MWKSAYLFFVAAAIRLLQRSLQKVQTDLVDGRLEKIVLHQTAKESNKELNLSQVSTSLF